MGTRNRVQVVVVAMVVALVLAGAGPAVAAKKKPKSCTLLKSAQISEVIEGEVTGPNGSGTFDACDFDVGPGLGRPGGGILIVQYYEKGPVATAVFSAMKDGAEGFEPGVRVPGTKVWFTPTTGAWTKKKGQAVNVSLSYSSDDPSAAATQDAVVALTELAAKKL